MAIVPRDKLGLNFENEFHRSTKIKIGVEGARFCLESWLCKACEVNKIWSAQASMARGRFVGKILEQGWELN